MKKIIKEELDKAVLPWLKENGLGALPNYSLEKPPQNIPGDLSSNLAMLSAKELKKNPREVALELSKLISSSLKNSVSEVTVAGAGFLNIVLSKEFIDGLFEKLLKEKEGFGKDEYSSDKKILIEFVSANPTGPLHIGHGRGAAIGDSLARIFSFFGYKVQKEYYLNDVGNQMEMLGRSLELRYKEQLGEKIDFPEDGYKGEYITDIAKKLVKAGAKNIDFKKAALDEMMGTIEKDLSDFGVSFDTWFSESTIAPDGTGKKSKVEKVCEHLQRQGYAEEKDGALWFLSTKYGDDKDRVLRRSDGRYTYLASDIAYHEEKISRHYYKLIDLWGADHHGYVPRMKAAIQALGENRDLLEIILYQLVSLSRNGQPVAMSTRSGEFVTLEEVIREVGKDACRFFFMLRAPDSQLEFDLELAKKRSSENPVFYVQYVFARCNSIFLEAEKQNIIKGRFFEAIKPGDLDLNLLNAAEERELILKLISFPDIIETCVKNFSPHFITTYLMETADIFHRFYEKCRVVNPADPKLSLARLTLVKAVAIIVQNGLSLLGVSSPEKM